MSIPGLGLENPFPGLRPFRKGEEHLFFGRESQVDRMVDKLASTRFLSVVGTSGTGKSSLVNCGLKPALHRGVMAEAGTSWRMVQFRPGGRPIRSMAREFSCSRDLFAGYKPCGISLLDVVDATLNMSSLGLVDLFEFAHCKPGTNLLVVVDQFEELFRYAKTGEASHGWNAVSGEAVAFVNLLLEAHAQEKYPIYVVLTMRSEFLGECSQFDRLPEVMNQSQYLVPRLTREERRETIAGPIGVAGAELHPLLLTRLVNDVGENPDQLSILQHAVNRTWAFWQEEESGGALLLKHYENEKVGTMAMALDLHAEEAYAELTTPRERKICEKVFKALTDTGTDARGIRRPLPFKYLCEIIDVGPEETAPVLGVFREPSRSFLMPPLAEALEPETVIDISHEILMRVWLRLKKWADEEAQSASTYRRVAETAELHRVRKARLWSDPDLQTALDWKTKQEPNAAWARLYRPGLEAALSFLAASKRVRDQEMAEAEFERRWHRVTPFLAVVLFVLFVLISPRLSKSLAPRVSKPVRQIFRSQAVAQGVQSFAPAPGQVRAGASDLSEVIINGFGVQVAAVICMLGYAGLSYGGKKIYRRLAFDSIVKEVSAQQPLAESVCVKDVLAAQTRPKEIPEVSPSSAGTLAPAGFWRILGAGCIDFGVLLLIGAVSFVGFAFLDALLQTGGHNYILLYIWFAIAPVLGFLYPLLTTWSRMGGTLGDLAWGIAVTDMAGRHPGFGRIFGRYAASGFSWLLLGLGFLIQPFTPRRQSLHDLIAGTMVIRRSHESRSAVAVVNPLEAR